MACRQPELASQGICATAIIVSAHTAASNKSAMAPRNLRVRIVMAEIWGISAGDAACAREGADYKGSENPFKASGADLTFATLRAARSSCERQIQSSTRINILLVVL